MKTGAIIVQERIIPKGTIFSGYIKESDEKNIWITTTDLIPGQDAGKARGGPLKVTFCFAKDAVTGES